MAKRRLILDHRFALGDTVLMTALVRDIQAAYPGYFEILVDTHCREVWTNNPHARLLRGDQTSTMPTTRVDISYANGIHAAGRGQRVHMLSWFHRDFATKTGMELEPLLPKGDLHLTAEESKPLVDGRYWLVLAGGKLDITCKWWLPERWQEVVDKLAAEGISCVQAGATFREHRHPSLSNVLNLLGQYPDARQFMNLVMHAEGVMCPVTSAMHIAACYDKPCVVLSGGREEPWWESYTNAYKAFGPRCAPVATEHRFLHTMGLLDCCKKKGCWKHRTVPLGNQDRWDGPERRCQLPVILPHASTPKCLEMISSDHVVEAVMSYYENGEIPPIGQAKGFTRKPLPPIAVNTEDELDRAVDTDLPVRSFKIPHVPGLSPAAVRTQVAAEREFYNAALGEPFDPQIQKPVLRTIPQPSMIDHPLIGGKLTVCVLCFGDHTELAKSCIGSILDTLPAENLDLRIGLNAVSQATMDYVMGLDVPIGLTIHAENAKKYPAMREMFNDGANPITTKYVVWFDDDAKVVDPSMWSQLCQTIVANHPLGSRLYGPTFIHDLQMYAKGGRDPLAWFRSAPWFRGRGLKVRGRGQEAPNGTVIDFAAGWFWAIATETIKAANVPCPRLNHNGGDITIGEQVHQAGYKVKGFNKDKALVWCPTKEGGGRRGYSEAFPWAS